ncbi:MAG: hypothetical protein ACLQVJ_10975 [Syntrophobacteraceae bacterium]
MAKKKINDDTLLQLIRDGNSPAGAARRRSPLGPAASQKISREPEAFHALPER